MLKKLLDSQADIRGNLPQQVWRNVPALVKRNGCRSAVCMSELLVRTTLPDLSKAESGENLHDFLRFENGNRTHRYATTICCVPTNSAFTSGVSSSSSISITS